MAAREPLDLDANPTDADWLRTRVDKHLQGQHDQKLHAPGGHEVDPARAFEPLYNDPDGWVKDRYTPQAHGRMLIYHGSTNDALADIRKFGLLSYDMQGTLRGKHTSGVGWGARDLMSFDVEYEPAKYVHIATGRDEAAGWALGAASEDMWGTPKRPGIQALVFEVEIPPETQVFPDPASSGKLVRDHIPPEWIKGYYVVTKAWRDDPRKGRHGRSSYYQFGALTPLAKGAGGTLGYVAVVVNA